MTVRNTTQSSLSTEYRRTVTRHDFATQATPYSSDASDRQTTTSQLGNVTDLTIRPRQLPRTHVLLVEQLGRLDSPTLVSRPREYDLKRHSNLKTSAIKKQHNSTYAIVTRMGSLSNSDSKLYSNLNIIICLNSAQITLAIKHTK